MNNNYKTILAVFAVLLMGIIVAGSSFAYWTWRSGNTTINFSPTPDYSCTVDGGGTISSTKIVPVTSCTNSSYTLTRKIQLGFTYPVGVSTMNESLWLNIVNMGTGLYSSNFKYVLNTSSTDCTTGVVGSGNFSGAGERVYLFTGNSKAFTGASTTYYLHLWLQNVDAGNPASEQGQSYSFTLGGECSPDSLS